MAAPQGTSAGWRAIYPLAMVQGTLQPARPRSELLRIALDRHAAPVSCPDSSDAVPAFRARPLAGSHSLQGALECSGRLDEPPLARRAGRGSGGQGAGAAFRERGGT